jgi:2-polyprenyl-3-methyl-5-hydroxy-6-metoxy-1,4-benzoquinol methylase
MFDGKYIDWNQKKIKAIISNYGFEYFHGKKILDLGSGHGDIGASLYRLGSEVTCVDAREEHLKTAGKKYPGIKTLKADLDRDWPFQTSKFDIILDLDLICHLRDYKKHIASICSAANFIVLETAVADTDI